MRRWEVYKGRRYKVDGMGIRGLEARIGRECCIRIRRGGPDGPGSTVEAYKLVESEKEDKVLVGMRSSEETGM